MPLFRKGSKIAGRQCRYDTSVPVNDSNEPGRLRRHGSSDKDRHCALLTAASSGDTQVLRLLIDQGCDLNAQDKLGCTALQLAASLGYSDTVRILIENGATIDKQDMTQEHTALHEAIINGHVSTVKLLIDFHSNPYVRNKCGATALHLACQHGRTTCVQMLLEHGCKADVKDKYNDTPLHTAVRYLHSGVCKVLLLSHQVNVNEQNQNGDTALHLSCNLGQKKLTKLLLEYGASLTIRNSQNETPLDIASRKQCPELVQIVKSGTFSGQNTKTPERNATARWKARGRRTKIRQRLEAARNAGSNWHLLFQDFESPSDDMIAQNSRLRLPLLRKGQQYYVDLAGKIHKGHNKDASLTCYCSPFFYRLAKQNTVAHQELLDEIDACHMDLSHEISDLREVTERKLADLHRDFKRHHRSRDDNSRESPKGRPLQRWHSESELENDVERGRLNGLSSLGSNESLSNASDDIYLERYWRRQSPAMSKKSAIKSNRSSKKSSQASTAFNPIQESFEESMRRFNHFDLDDSCTTPTSASSQPYSCSLTSHSRSTGGAQEPECNSQRASIYSCHSGDPGSSMPQPPSLDSGYGTGTMAMSPSPALFNSAVQSAPNTPDRSCRSLLPCLNEAATQTDRHREQNCDHEYTELESLVKGHKPCSRQVNQSRPAPQLSIPPPPRKPLPPLPQSKPSSRAQSPRTNGFCTNV